MTDWRRRIRWRVRDCRRRIDAAVGLLSRRGQRRRARELQQAHLESLRLGERERVVVFLVPDAPQIRGGTLQILSMSRLSKRILDSPTDAVVDCWIPGHGRDTCRLELYDPDLIVCPLEETLARCKPGTNVVLHAPELLVNSIEATLTGNSSLASLLQQVRLHLNILNQNHLRMPAVETVRSLADRLHLVTITTGHPDWSRPQARAKWGVPIHWVPTWYCLDDAPWQPYESKRDLLIVSPERRPYRDRILSIIRTGMPNLEIRVIQGIPFAEYTQLERDAKWSLTFGEGNDGYFYGPVTRGGVSFAVHNETFNGRDTTRWVTVYPTPEAMAERIVDDMKRLDEKHAYESYNALMRPEYVANRSARRLEDRLRDFYQGRLTLHPRFCKSIDATHCEADS